MAAVIIPNVSKFIGSSHVSAANAELAQVGTAAQAAAADQTGGVFASAFLLDQATLNGGVMTGAGDLKQYITGNIVGEYWITIDGAVNLTGGAYSKLTGSVAGDPWYNGLYFDETKAQFSSTVPASGNVALGVTGVSPGNQPSKN